MAPLFSNVNYRSESTIPYYAARVISDLANPLFLPPLILGVTGYLRHVTAEELSWMIALSLLFYTLIPLAITFYLLRNGNIQSLDLPRRQARNTLFIYAIISSSIGSLILAIYFYFRHPLVTMVAVIFFLNPLMGYLINLRWKISMHTASIASGGAIFFALFYVTSHFDTSVAGIFSLFLLLILLPLMVWARHRLNIHSTAELITGATAGIILTLLEFGIMIFFW